MIEKMTKKQVLAHLDRMMHKAIADNNLVYEPLCTHVTFHYENCRMTVATSFDCLDRAHRRVSKPWQNGKRRTDKALETAIKRFQE